MTSLCVCRGCSFVAFHVQVSFVIAVVSVMWPGCRCKNCSNPVIAATTELVEVEESMAVCSEVVGEDVWRAVWAKVMKG